MPNIPEYGAPSWRLTPAAHGFEAFETLGRRISPIYNQAARAVRERASVEIATTQLAERTRQLIAALGDQRVRRPGPGPGASVRVRSPHGGGGGGNSRVASGAAGLARALSGDDNPGEYKRPPFHYYDPETGMDRIGTDRDYGGGGIDAPFPRGTPYSTSGGVGMEPVHTINPAYVYGPPVPPSWYEGVGAKIEGWVQSIFGSGPAASAEFGGGGMIGSDLPQAEWE